MTRFTLFALSLLGASAAAQPVEVAGTRAALAPPVGYEPSERFAGFENVAIEASLMVVEIPGAPLAEVTAGFTPEALAASGVQNAEIEEVTVGGVASLLVTGEQRAYGQTHRRWSLVTGDSAGVVIVNGAIPEDATPEAVGALRAAVLSLTLGAASGDLFAGLPFTLDAPDALPERRRLGAALLLSQTYGETPPPGAPLYIAALGAEPLAADLEEAARRRALRTQGLGGYGEVATRPLAVDGRDGVEAVVTGTEAETGARITTVLVLVPHTETGYIILQALVGTDAADEWLPRFRAITESLVWAE